MKILKDEKENFTMRTNKYSGTKTEQNPVSYTHLTLPTTSRV